ncbi:MAG TPA: sugar-binding transcriptional regulator [Anaeromyxobacter sp.]|nr:sugar-binding transcriptional regulator [Anaeromyxobacter sp.]
MASKTRDEDGRLLYKMARAYYEDGATQERIAARFGVSRPKVSRLLQQARDSGVVHISVRRPESGCPDLERELEGRFDLDEAVLAPRDRAPVLERVGTAAASYFARTVQPGEVVGLSWGTSLREFAAKLPHLDLPKVTVVQLIGGLGSLDSGVNGAELTRRVAERCSAKPRILQAPGVVATPAVKAALLSDREIAQSLELGRKATVAWIGLGVPRAASALFGPEGLLTRKDLEAILAKGAVADVCLRYFDAAGRSVETGFEGRVLGIELPAFLAIPRRVAVAGGPEKVPAIRGALAGKLVNVLVSDEETARALLEGEED